MKSEVRKLGGEAQQMINEGNDTKAITFDLAHSLCVYYENEIYSTIEKISESAEGIRNSNNCCHKEHLIVNNTLKRAVKGLFT